MQEEIVQRTSISKHRVRKVHDEARKVEDQVTEGPESKAEKQKFLGRQWEDREKVPGSHLHFRPIPGLWHLEEIER